MLRRCLLLGSLLALLLSVRAEAQSAYITNKFSNTVTVINTSTNSVIGSPIKVGSYPEAVAVSPDGMRVYVGNQGMDQGPGSVSIIDTSKNAVIATVPVGQTPGGIAVSPDGSKVYVATLEGDVVELGTAAGNNALRPPAATISVYKGNLNGIAVTPDGSQIWVVGVATWIIDAATRSVTGLNPMGPMGSAQGYGGIAFSPDGSVAYIATQGGSGAAVRTATENLRGSKVHRVLYGFDGEWGVAVTPDGSRVYATHSNLITVFDTLGKKELKKIILPGSGRGISITPDGTRAYVTSGSGGSSRVYVIETAGNTLLKTIVVGGKEGSSFGSFISKRLP